MMTNTGKFCRDVEDYINNKIAAYAYEISNIESVRCTRRSDRIFMELVHEDGDVRYFDCSALDKSTIGIMFSHIIANDPVSREIRDRKVKKEVRRLFRQGV